MHDEKLTSPIETMVQYPRYVASVPQAVLDHVRQHACCTVCHDRIGDASPFFRGDRIYHERCAPQRGARINVSDRIRLAPPTPAPSIIAVLSGSAGTLCDPAGCSIPQADGSVIHESFATSAFDRTVVAHAPLLRLDHDMRIEGKFTKVWVDRLALRFRFQLYDSIVGQKVLQLTQAGRMAGVSIGFTRSRSQSHYARGVEVYTDVLLNEISILSQGRRPGWYGTWIRAE